MESSSDEEEYSLSRGTRLTKTNGKKLVAADEQPADKAAKNVEPADFVEQPADKADKKVEANDEQPVHKAAKKVEPADEQPD